MGTTTGTGLDTSAVQYWYDDANRVTAMATGLSNVNVSLVEPDSGSITKYEYDLMGYVSKETDPLGNSAVYSNDYTGNVVSGQDRNGTCFDNEYGAFGKTYSTRNNGDDEEESYITYDSLGRIKQTKDENNDNTDTISYIYDAFGRLSEKSTDTGKHTYAYDVNSNVTSYEYSINNSVKDSETYEYNAANELTKQTVNDKIITYTYDKHTLEQKNVDGNITNITYNSVKLPTAYTTKNGDTVLSSYTYTYALDGNRLSETDSVNGINRAYEYDKNGRLTKEDITGNITKSMSYEYDTCGNRITEIVTGDENYVMTNTYNSNNRLMEQIKTENGSTVQEINYYYNKNGSRTGRQTPDYSAGTTVRTAEVYNYDLNNRMTSYQKGHTVTTYTYGADGLRKSKTTGDTTTSYAWNGENLTAELNGDSVTGLYSYGADGIVMSTIDSTVSYYLKDAHGNVVGKTDTSGTKTDTKTYDAFGNVLGTEVSDTDPFGYCGEYTDAESGMVYLRNRYYDTAVGVFITEDPAKDGVNWYSYCGGNPVMLVDPSGELREGYTDENGIYHDDPDAEDFGKDSLVYSSLVTLGEMWKLRPENRADIEELANKVREFGKKIGFSIRLESAIKLAPKSANATDVVIAAGDIDKAALSVLAKKESTRYADSIYNDKSDGSQHNALKHTMWSALLTKYAGDIFA